MRTLCLTFALVLAMALAACGYKTPLTLPKPDAVAPKPAAAATAATPSDTAKPVSK